MNKTSSSQIYDPFTQFGIAPFEEPVVPEPLADDYPNCPMFMAVPSDMVRLIVLHCKELIDAANARADKAESTMAPRREQP